MSYLEGCTAPKRDENQLHAAVVELVALENATVKYSTVQNWYAGDEEGLGGIYNFVTKRGKALGRKSKISWTQVETGSAITWKYPSVILQGDNSVGEFYSVAVVNRKQQADTGHEDDPHRQEHEVEHRLEGDLGGRGQQLVPRPGEGAAEGDGRAQLHAVRLDARRQPLRRAHVPVHRGRQQHGDGRARGSTSKIGEDQIFYLKQRGLSAEQAVSMIVCGFCREVFKELPMEFALEAQQLLGITLEGSVG